MHPARGSIRTAEVRISALVPNARSDKCPPATRAHEAAWSLKFFLSLGQQVKL